MRNWSSLRALSVLAAVSGAALLCRPVGAQPRWKLQYFFDQRDSSFHISDLQCPSALRCVAAGVILYNDGRGKGAVVSTNDGGAHWSLQNVKESPLSLFFLNESLGWMVTDQGLWTTGDGGATWKKLDAPKWMMRVYFRDPTHGFAVGSTVYETVDGGKKWVSVTSAQPKNMSYESIAFRGQYGIAAGIPVKAGVPAILESQDGGKHWQAPNAGFYRPVKVGLLQGEIAFVDRSQGSVRWMPGGTKPETIFDERNRVVTDFAQLPVPGKLKMLRSTDLKSWQEMDVDYRAVAQGAVLAALDASHVWVATDTGMILQLSPSKN